MGVFQIFKIVQMVPNRATHDIYALSLEDVKATKTITLLPLLEKVLVADK